MSPFDITLAAPSARNEWKVTSYGSAVPYAAMISFKTRRVIGFDGRTTESTCQVYIDGDVTVDGTYQITLPSSMAPTQPPIVGVEKPADDMGIHHTVILLGGR